MTKTKREMELEEIVRTAQQEIHQIRDAALVESRKGILGKCYWYDDTHESAFVRVDAIDGFIPVGFKFKTTWYGPQKRYHVSPKEQVMSFHESQKSTHMKNWQEIHIGVFDTAWQNFFQEMMKNVPIPTDFSFIVDSPGESGRAYLDPETGASVYIPDGESNDVPS